MGRINWKIDSSLVDDFNRDGQFTPYSGPIPQNGVYKFTVKTCKYVAGAKKKHPQLRVGLELVPRDREEKRFAGYFIIKFMTVSPNPKAAFNYVPFLDAIGVSGDDFTQRTTADEDGNVKKIGKWRMDGETEVLAQLQTGSDQEGNPRKEIGWIGAYDEDADQDDSDDDDDDDELEDDDDDDE